MGRVILFKGQYEVIRMMENKNQANALYSFICDYFSKKNYTTVQVETNSIERACYFISPPTQYIIGHSNGARRILAELEPADINENIRNIILFDADLGYLDKWSGSQIPMLVFLSSGWSAQKKRRYKKNENMIVFDDNHYFTGSFREIEEILDITLTSD